MHSQPASITWTAKPAGKLMVLLKHIVFLNAQFLLVKQTGQLQIKNTVT